MYERTFVHPAGRTVFSHWSANGFIMVVYEKFFSRKILTELKKLSHRQPL